MSNLAVSVIIPTYNRGHLLPRALDSALAQVEPGDEVIVADDGSSDNTQEVAKRYGDRVMFHMLPHSGAGRTRNRAIALSSRPLVAFLDSDDEWMPGKLAAQRRLLETRPDLVFCFSDFAVRDGDGNETRRYLERWHQDPRSWDDILAPGIAFSSLAMVPEGMRDFQVHIGSLYLAEMERDYVLTSSLAVRREKADDALQFAEDLPISEDKECFARLARAGPAAYMDIETAWQIGHDAPRLTDLAVPGLVAARLTLLKRIWGNDDGFLAEHRDRLTEAIDAQHLKRAYWYLAHGRTREARADLREVKGGYLQYRFLSAIPEPLMRAALALRRNLRRSLGPA